MVAFRYLLQVSRLTVLWRFERERQEEATTRNHDIRFDQRGDSLLSSFTGSVPPGPEPEPVGFAANSGRLHPDLQKLLWDNVDRKRGLASSDAASDPD